MRTRYVPVVWLTLLPGAVTLHAQTRPGTDAQYIAKAEQGGPKDLAAKAAIAKLDAQGKITTVRPGTNGFTCIVGVPGDQEAPFCADRMALQWVVDAVSNKPAPTNTAPGIAYMAVGGTHHEMADGTIVMEPGTGTHPVKEPPHWMLFWAFDPTATGFPTKENASGVYIMFAGTPYAHLMVYQDPNKMQNRRTVAAR